MTSHCIPFTTIRNLDLAEKLHGDARILRLELGYLQKSHKTLARHLWIDSGFDGLHKLSDKSKSWIEFMSQFPHYDDISVKSFQNQPEKRIVNELVSSLLSKCRELDPEWLSVPQLPHASDSSRNKINRALAEATAEWKKESNFSGKLILPAIFTNQNQINRKQDRTAKISLVKRCLFKSNADGVWIVDSSLNDSIGSSTFSKTRFPGIVNFHSELKKGLPDTAAIIGGPYWGLNLILWSRGLVHYPAIGVGSGYQYSVSGQVGRPASASVPLSPLRRRATVDSALEKWLKTAISMIPDSESSHDEFHSLLSDIARLGDPAAARVRTAEFYRSWFSSIANMPPSGRALALYQDFSSAYVLGKTLDTLPPTQRIARRPEAPAEQFMLACL